MFGKRRRYSLGKANKLLHSVYTTFRRKRKKLTDEQSKNLHAEMRALRDAIRAKDRDGTDQLAIQLDDTAHHLFPKTTWHYVREVIIAIVLAIVIATVIRQMWFEPMEIPSGSMRPTFEEFDRLLVRKTTFGLNIPMKPAQFYFNPDRVLRTGVFIFTSEDMDIPDQDTTYFGFPSKRRLIKRLMGKPGDTVYFYGGQLYGIDQENNDLTILRDAPYLKRLEYLPFLTFDGKVEQTRTGALFKQMNQPIGRLQIQNGKPIGQIFNGTEWVVDQPFEANDQSLHTYSDFYGIRNIATGRLLTSSQAAALSEAPLDDLSDGTLYLELRHHPSLTYPKPQLLRGRPTLTPEVSLLPLNQTHLDTLMGTLYTTRFILEGGRAYADRIKNATARTSPYRPLFTDVPDGRYEFYYGKGYEVGFGGILHPLPPNHPLYSRDPQNVQRLYNLGIEFSTIVAPQSRNQAHHPSRYVYFRDGDLYLMGSPVLKSYDPALINFLDRESKRASRSTPTRPYLPFKDYGPPPSAEFIRTFGLHLPPESYLALGDNPAASGDSRLFGFVPESNIRGTPGLLLWPPGPRWGTLTPPPYPWFNGPRIFVWALALAIAIAYYTWRHRRLNSL
jgi:signal peptidase I